MEIKTIIKSGEFVEKINQIDNLICDLLYSKNNGYINTKSKNALLEAENIISKFDYEAAKILKNVDYNEIEDILTDKKSELTTQIKNHYDIELENWIYELYQNMLENCFFFISINKENKAVTDKFYSRAISSVSWLCDILQIDDETKKTMIEKIDKEFKEIMIKTDNDYLPKINPIYSDVTIFLQLRNMIFEDIEAFLKLDFKQYISKLSNKDINYFNKLKTELLINETLIKDDLLLVNSAIEVLKINSDEDKYSFIQKVIDDFNQLDNKKENTDEIKIKLVKKRIDIFKNNNKNNTSDYFKKLLLN